MSAWRGSWWRLPSLPAVVLSAALSGAVVGVLVGTVPPSRGQEPWSPTAAVLAGVVAALLAGAAETVGRRSALAHAGGLEGSRARAAAAASHGGEVPQDPEVRAAALRMVVARFQEQVGRSRGPVVAFAVVVLAQFGLHGPSSWLPWLLLVLWAGTVVETVRGPRQLQRRILELEPLTGARPTSVPG